MVDVYAKNPDIYTSVSVLRWGDYSAIGCTSDCYVEYSDLPESNVELTDGQEMNINHVEMYTVLVI